MLKPKKNDLDLLMRMYSCTKSLISGPSYFSIMPSLGQLMAIFPPKGRSNFNITSSSHIHGFVKSSWARKSINMPTTNNTAKQRSISLSKQEELLNVQTQYFVKPEDMKLTERQKLKKFLWNPEEKKLLGRDALSWCKWFYYLISDTIVFSRLYFNVKYFIL